MCIDLLEQKCARTAEQGIDAIQQPLRRPPVAMQRFAPRRFLKGAQIGEDVGAPEAVDRLLRITYEKERYGPVAENAAEDEILRRICILKFIDERGAVTLAYRFSKCISVNSLQYFPHDVDEVVERQQILLP